MPGPDATLPAPPRPATGRAALIGAGLLAATLVLALVLGTMGVVLWRAEAPPRLGPADWGALRFTLLQAALSAALSVGLAVPVARALARRRFPGRGVLVTLLGAPFILPVIVAVMGLLAVFGRSGLLNQGLGALGVEPVSIYGLQGVVLAHVFFNLPLAVRLILQGWLAVPAERFRLAAALGMGPAEIRRRIEYPMLAAVAPGAAMIVFLICLTSFAVALTLGGGPRATTIELAIYQAFRFEFDLGRAAFLAALQVAVTGVAALLALRVASDDGFGTGLDRVVERWDAGAAHLRALDILAVAAAALFLLVPLAMVVLKGLPALLATAPVIAPAALRSLGVAALSTVLALGLTLPLARAVTALRARPHAARGLEAVGYLSVAASPLVLGTGLFILLHGLVPPARLALPVTAVVNAVLALPFLLRIVTPAVAATETGYGRLADSLGMTGWARLRLLLLPRIRRPLGFAAGLAAALSIGDLGVIALFADPNAATLPLEVYRLMAAYRTGDAAGAALWLLLFSLGAFWICDRGGRLDAGT